MCARVRPQEHIFSTRSVFVSSQTTTHKTYHGPSEAVGAERQCQTPSGAHTYPSSFLTPTVGENDSCMDALMQQQDWDETYRRHWPESSRLFVQNGPEQNDESETVPDTQQVSQTQPPPMRVRAAASNLRQTSPAVKSPPPHDSGGTASQQVAAQKRNSGHAQLQCNTIYTMTFDVHARHAFFGSKHTTLFLFRSMAWN